MGLFRLRESEIPPRQKAAIPLKPAAADNPATSPKLFSVPSELMPKMLTVPVPEFSVYRNFPSVPIARSRFVLPDGLVPTVVPETAVSDQFDPMLNPEMVAEPAFEV